MHESAGRLRIHIIQNYMTADEADLWESYLCAFPFVREAKVSERTANVVVRYDKNDDTAREKIISAISRFDYETANSLTAAPVPTSQNARQTRREYENKMAGQIVWFAAKRLFLPVSVREVFTVIRAVPYLCKGVKSLLRGKLEVSVLDAASILVSLLRGEFDTAGSVMFLLGIGDTMEEWTHKKSVDDLAGVMALHADKVWLKLADGQEVLTDITKVKTGDMIIVRTGQLIPLDGEAVSGDATVNQSSMTGEPLGVHKKAGAYLYAGSVVEEGELVIRVRQESGSGRYDRIVSMIEESEKLKSNAEAKAAHLADRLVPWTFGATALTYLFTRDMARASSILMVDFCCALKLSMPIAVLSAMREAGEHHIAVKGGKFMEAFAESETIVFDKTGTLTIAAPRVRAVVPFGNNDENEMLRLAACLEEHYPHSLANAVVRAAKERGLTHEEEHSKVEYVVAHGIASSVGKQKVRIGSYHFIFEDEGCRLPRGAKAKFDALPDDCSHLYLSIDDRLAAVLLIEDPLKREAKAAVDALHKAGISRIVMMTGDSEKTACAVASAIGVDDYFSEVLPEDKAAFIRREHDAGRKVIMVGDGVNDSPALSEADVGIAMNSGAAIAREIADITISEDDLFSLLVMRRLSEGLMARIDRNYRTIIAFNSFLIVMGMLGIFPSATTALLHNASTIGISVHSMTKLLRDDVLQLS